MIPVAKFAAIGAALGDATVLMASIIQSDPLPSLERFGAAGVTGAASSIAVLLAWKATADKRLDRIETEKASRADLLPIQETLKEIKEELRYLSRQTRREKDSE